MLKLLVSLVLTFGCTISLSAQNSVDKNNISKEDRIKTVVSSENGKSLDSIKAQIKKLKSKNSFKFKYDRFKDNSAVFSEPLSLIGFGEGLGSVFAAAAAGAANGSDPSIGDLPGLAIQVYFTFEKNVLDQDVEQFIISFNSTGRAWRFLKNKELNVIIDGERMTFGEGELNAEISSFLNGTVTVESLLFKVSRAELFKLSEAKELEIRIGTREQKLKNKHKQIFKDIISLGTLSRVEAEKK